jgi:hypothetical protein
MKEIIYCLIAILFLTACSSATQTAYPTYTPAPTYTPIPTQTPYPTYTAIPKPTTTSTPIPSTKVITDPPQKFLITKLDLPKDGRFYTPEGWEKAFANSEIVARSGIEEGKKFIADTGRVAGWRKNFAPGDETAPFPRQITEYLMQFKTPEGAKIAFLDQANDMYLDPEVNLVMNDVTESRIGDDTKVTYIERYLKYSNSYDVDTTSKDCILVTRVLYRNYVIEVLQFNDLGSCPTTVKSDLGMDIAEKILTKLENAPVEDQWPE